jgi:hypothetical protein
MTNEQITAAFNAFRAAVKSERMEISFTPAEAFRAGVKAAQNAAAPIAQAPRKLTMSMFATVADLEAAKAAQKAQPAPAQGEPDDAKDAARFRKLCKILGDDGLGAALDARLMLPE